MRLRVLLICMVVAMSLALCGCDLMKATGSGVSVRDKAAGLSQGWVRYESADGFSLDVPESWLKLDLAGEDIEASIQMLTEANPDLGEFLDKSSFRSQLAVLVSSGVKLMLYDTKADISELHFATNLNVVRIEVPAGMALDKVVSEDVAQVRTVIGSGLLTDIREGEVVLGTTPAYKLDYIYGMYMPDGSYLDAEIIQYVLLSGSTEYVLTFTTTGPKAGLRSITFEAIAETFRVPK